MNQPDDKIESTLKLLGSSRRVIDCFHALEQTAASYHSPESFRRNLNSAIQELRNVTFILQSEKAAILGFDDWYISKQAEMRNDPVLRWLHDSRNVVVKQEDLKKKSMATIRCMNWEDKLVDESEVDPFVPIEGMAMYFAKMYSKIPDRNLRKCIIEVEKRWTVPEFPNSELLEILAHCYTYQRKLIMEAHAKIGSSFNAPEVSNLMNKVRDFRVARISPADGLFRTPRDIKMEMTKETEMLAEKRYGKIEVPTANKQDGMFGDMDHWLVRAKAILQKDGHHMHLILIYKEGKMIDMIGLLSEDQEDKYLVVRRLANRVKELDADGIISINEMWEAPQENRRDGSLIRASDSRKRKESLMLTAVDQNGRVEALRTPFRRSFFRKKIIMDETIKLEESKWIWLEPLMNLWKEKLE